MTATQRSNENLYETDNLLQMYLWLNFTIENPKLHSDPNALRHALNFPQRVAQLLDSLVSKYNDTKDSIGEINVDRRRALDVGCAVGGSAFELAKTFHHVEAFDFSERFIQAAKEMQTKKRISFHLPIEGDIFESVTAVLPPSHSSISVQKNDQNHASATNKESIESRVHFFVGDACKLPSYQLGTFDAILLSNLLCRLPDPMSCLDALPFLINDGGIVLFITPYSWLEEYTNKKDWLGGHYCEGNSGKPATISSAHRESKVAGEKVPVYTKERLREVMEEKGFELIHEEAMPLIIREHARKYQYIISDATGWRKK